MTLSNRICLLLGILAVSVLGFPAASPAVQQSLSIEKFREVSRKKVDHGYFEFTFKADVRNTGSRKMSSVVATVTSSSDRTIVVDGNLSFGEVPAHGKTTSIDTFTIRRHGQHPVRWGDLAWTITGTSVNQQPTADAGPDRTIPTGYVAILDGSKSSDPDGNHLSFRWSFVSIPAGSSAVLYRSTRVHPLFIVDVPGRYVVQLIVNDGTVDSNPARVIISTGNSAPVANAGQNQTTLVGDMVTLDGSRSSDADGDPLHFSWSFVSQPSGSIAALSDSSGIKPTFQVDKPGTYIARLIVDDGQLNSAPATVSVTTQNSKPVANAGAGQTVFVGDSVTLDAGKSTDVDGDPLTFRWSFTSMPIESAAVLSNASDVKPTFIVDKPGTYVVQVVVNDGTADSNPATVTISTQNSKPVAAAGADQTVYVGNTVTLDGSKSSDVDGDILSFKWSMISRPAGSGAVLSDSSSVKPTFVIDAPGTYVLQLIVNDGTVDGDPSSMTVITINSRPVADAGPDQTVYVGNTVTLDGSKSWDADWDPLTFRWALLSRPDGSGAVFSNPFSANPTFTVDLPGSYLPQLIVNDGTVDSIPATVTVGTQNSKPVAEAGPALTVFVGETVNLDGSGSSDADRDTLTYTWAFTSIPRGSGATLSDTHVPTPSFIPDLDGIYVVQLIVYDGTVNSDPDTVTISVPAPVSCSIDAKPTEGVVPFDVQFSSSASGGVAPYSYLWTFQGSGESFTTANFTYKFQTEGSHSIVLKVTDSTNHTASATTSITALMPNSDPVSNAGGPYEGSIGSPLQFDGTKSSDPDGDPLTFAWDFGDGATGSGDRPAHVYSASGAYTVSLTVTDGRGGSSTSRTRATILQPPTIGSLSVYTGPAGTVVTINGTGFDAGSAGVAFNGTSAVIAGLTATSITTSVPLGATTGPVSVVTRGGTAASSRDFTATSLHDFELAADPPQMTAAAGSQVTYSVRVNGDEGFSGLVSLDVQGLPDGFSGFFSPASITSGQSSTLTVTTCDCILSGVASITITGSATIEGKTRAHSSTVALELLAPGVTTLVGRVVDTEGTPIKNVEVSVGTAAAITDVGGNFVIENPPTGDRVVLIDGFPASSENAKYPTIPITMSIAEGITNQLPYVPHFHAQKNFNFTAINSADETVVEDPELPNFQLRIPPGVDIIGWDGQANTKVSIRKVPLDALPIPSPPPELHPRSVYMFYFGKRGGGVPTVPIPVTAPNDLGLNPGDKAELWYYNESTDINEAPNAWSLAGTGTVSEDGDTISSDPGVGIPRFCCGAMAYVPSLTSSGDDINPDGCRAGDPVDLATGVFIHSTTDLALPGRIPIVVNRTHRTRDNLQGPFGPGTYFSYDWYLLRSEDTVTLAIPPGTRIQFTRNRDGSFTNKTMPRYRGAVVTYNQVGTSQLQMKDGTSFTFSSYWDPNTAILVAQTDRNGNTLTLKREVEFNVTRIIGADGREMASFTIPIEARDRYRVISDIAGRKVTYDYASNYGLASVTDQGGGVTRYEYDSSGRISAIIDPEGNTTVRNSYDANGRVCRQQHANGGIWKYSYITAGDAALPDSDILMKFGPSSDPCTTAKATNSTVVATVMLDPNNNPTLYRFNGAGYPTKITDALGQSTSFERATGTNLLLSTTDSLGRVTRYTYDENGNTSSVSDPAGNTTYYEYTSDFNSLKKITDALGNVTSLEYDSHGNLLKATNPLGHSVSISYNEYGQPVSLTDPLGHTSTYDYDDAGNMITITDPTGNKSTRAYDELSRLIQSTDPSGKSTGFTYDPMNRITEITDSLNNLTRFAYDKNGSLLSVTDANGHSVTYTYDITRKVASMKDQLGSVETYGYDPGGNLTSVTDRKGQTTQLEYDKLNRKSRATFADGGTVQYQYDAVKRLIEINDSVSGTIAFEYATFGGCQGCSGKSVDRLIREITPTGTISYDYDALGRRTSTAIAGQSAVGYSYDAGGRLTGIDNSDAGHFGIGYDNANRRILLSMPNGVNTSYAYDSSNRLLGINHASLSGIFENPVYTYDAAGQRTSLSTLLPQAQLPEAITAAYDAANRLITLNDQNLVYDANGSLVQRNDPSGAIAYTWDARNRLTAIEGPEVSAQFAYDALNRRVEKTVNGRTIRYQYAGNDIAAEIEEGSISAKYIRGDRIDEPLARIDKSGILFYHTDGLGSTIALTDATGTVRTNYLYDAYGQTTIVGDESDNPFQYTGRENDGTGLYFYRARYYDPILRRFISEDPLGFGGGDVNLFAYVLNNPVNAIDPLGLRCQTTPGSPYPGGDPLRVWEEVKTEGYWTAVVNYTAVQLIKYKLKIRVPVSLDMFTYIEYHTIYALFNLYVDYTETCYDDCTGEKTSGPNYIYTGIAGGTQEVILNRRIEEHNLGQLR